MNLRNRISMKLEKRERVEPKLELKPVMKVHTAQPDMEKIREELRNELRNELVEMLLKERDEWRMNYDVNLMEKLNKERDEWKRNYDIEINQLKDVIHYNTMKILHETASKIYELEMRCNELVDDCSMDKY